MIPYTKIRCRVLATCLMLILVSSVRAKEIPHVAPGQVGLNAKKLAKVGRAVLKLVDEGEIAGAITVVARHGKIALFETYGYSDVAKRAPMKGDAIMRFYSMTKPMTTAAAMMLWERGELDLDEPVATYLPEFKNLRVYREGADAKAPRRAPSIRDLMRHSSGLTYGFFGNHAVDKAYGKADLFNSQDSSSDFIDKLAKLPLMFEPGEKFNYSVSVDVLGRVIEVVSGQRLSEFLKANICDPLGMKDTEFWVKAGKADRLATVYQPGEGGGIGAQADDGRYLKKPAMDSGGAGLTSTARDYLRFLQMIANGGELHGVRLLKDQTVQLMRTNQLDHRAMPIGVGDKRPGQGFGLGFSVVVDVNVETAGSRAGEFGWGGAASTHFWISPEDDLVVIALQQFMPYSFKLEHTIKPLIYDAIEK